MVNGRKLSVNDLTLSSLKYDGYKSVFIGIGNPEPKSIPIFKGLTESQGYYTSKGFLPKVSAASKPGMCACKSQLPQVSSAVFLIFLFLIRPRRTQAIKYSSGQLRKSK